jgi:hypothetical protein
LGSQPTPRRSLKEDQVRFNKIHGWQDRAGWSLQDNVKFISLPIIKKLLKDLSDFLDTKIAILA